MSKDYVSKRPQVKASTRMVNHLSFLSIREQESHPDPLCCSRTSRVELGSSTCEGPNLPLSPDQALAVGMVLQLSV